MLIDDANEEQEARPATLVLCIFSGRRGSDIAKELDMLGQSITTEAVQKKRILSRKSGVKRIKRDVLTESVIKVCTNIKCIIH